MAQSSHQAQVQSQQQTLSLSPQQILAVKLLELPSVELEDRVRAELLENPALEEGEDTAANEEFPDPFATDPAEDTGYNERDDYRDDDEVPDYKLQEYNRSQGERPEEIPFSANVSFFESLMEQLGEHRQSERQRVLTEYLIGSLDNDGLLRKPMADIREELAIYSGMEADEEELDDALQVIQQFDPAGIGARSLQECLLIQIRRKMDTCEDCDMETLKWEEAIIEKAYDDFTNKRWGKIQQRFGLSDALFEQAVKEIVRLTPRPGFSMGETLGKNLQQIIPDFIVETDDEGNISLSLNNPNLPELRISRNFTRMLAEQSKHSKQSREQRDALLFLQQKIGHAQGFIDALKQRQTTLLTTMQAIIDLQRPFFLEGDESLLRPLILKDVAEKTGLNISTISRVSNSKYVQTPFGLFKLRFFFADSYVTQDGEEMSTRRIKELLKEIVGAEDKSNPVNDDRLAQILKERGYPMARRTVAKYREQLGIPVARLRKEHLAHS